MSPWVSEQENLSLVSTNKDRGLNNSLSYQQRIVGLLVGGAVGDAIGLPSEGMTKERIARRWPDGLRHRFVLGYGMISDDTEHALMTAQALIEAGDDVAVFRRRLAWKLRWWIIALPAGAGLATARACLRLWIGFSPEQSGVNSAGNGPAMRSAIIGARFWDDSERRRKFVLASTRITHADKRAYTAALAVAEAAACSVAGQPRQIFTSQLQKFGDDAEWQRIANRLGESLAVGSSVAEFAASLGSASAVSGYAYHSVPVALFAWLRHGDDFVETLQGVIQCGGDTDTVAAIAGALSGCKVGPGGIPSSWLVGVRDWPRSLQFVERVAERVAQCRVAPPVTWFWPAVILRNLCFFLIVLFHGFRRLLPPYANHPTKD